MKHLLKPPPPTFVDLNKHFSVDNEATRKITHYYKPLVALVGFLVGTLCMTLWLYSFRTAHDPIVTLYGLVVAIMLGFLLARGVALIARSFAIKKAVKQFDFENKPWAIDCLLAVIPLAFTYRQRQTLKELIKKARDKTVKQLGFDARKKKKEKDDNLQFFQKLLSFFFICEQDYLYTEYRGTAKEVSYKSIQDHVIHSSLYRNTTADAVLYLFFEESFTESGFLELVGDVQKEYPTEWNSFHNTVSAQTILALMQKLAGVLASREITDASELRIEINNFHLAS